MKRQNPATLDSQYLAECLNENLHLGRVWHSESAWGISIPVRTIRTHGLYKGFFGRRVAEIQPGISMQDDFFVVIENKNYSSCIESAFQEYDRSKKTNTKVSFS